MECNKEEAIKVKEIAENRMKLGDFTGALRIARKAQRLFPALDNVTQLLTVCEVHCSAQRRPFGKEMDWYSILQIEWSVDEMTIKKQYKRLALLLHPDKNKFPGAEAAFKFIGEASSVLLDKAKHRVYDLKFRAAERKSQAPLSHQRQHKYGAANNVPKAPNSKAKPSGRCSLGKQEAGISNFHRQYTGANNAPKRPGEGGTPSSPEKKTKMKAEGVFGGASFEGRIKVLLQRILDSVNVHEGLRMQKLKKANVKAKWEGGKLSECKTSTSSQINRKR